MLKKSLLILMILAISACATTTSSTQKADLEACTEAVGGVLGPWYVRIWCAGGPPALLTIATVQDMRINKCMRAKGYNY
jgi:hypothetical protein